MIWTARPGYRSIQSKQLGLLPLREPGEKRLVSLKLGTKPLMAFDGIGNVEIDALSVLFPRHARSNRPTAASRGRRNNSVSRTVALSTVE